MEESWEWSMNGSGTLPVRSDRLSFFNLQREKKKKEKNSTTQAGNAPRRVYSPKCATFPLAWRVLARGCNRTVIFS